jgi:pimeloyl-ACP methyl ester carboxylesterase
MAYVDSHTGRLFYELIDLVVPWNAGRETIIFHHGIGASAGIWAEWLPELIKEYRIVVFEMRGYGRSSIASARFEWTLESFSNDVIAILDAVGAEQAHLVGESIGGTIALQCAISNPDRVRTLTISNGADVGTCIQKVEAWQKEIDDHGIKAWSDQFMRDRFYDGALDEARRSWYARQQEAWTRGSILSALRMLVGTNLRPELGRARCPVLLMHGDDSPFIPVNAMADMNKLLPNSRLHVFGHARHGLPFSHAAQCAKVLREFLLTAAAP